MMYEEPPLSPDLEWMLESGQVGRDLLALALVSEFYSSLYRLARAVLGEAEAAAYTAVAAFVRALLSVHSFRGAESARTWFFRIAAGEIDKSLRVQPQVRASSLVLPPHEAVEDRPGDSSRAGWNERIQLNFSQLDSHTRQIVFLYYVLGWDRREIAQLFRVQEISIRNILDDYQERLSQSLHHTEGKDSGNHDVLVKESLAASFPDPALEPGELEKIAALVHAEAQKQSVGLGWAFRFREIALIGMAILGVLGLFWGLNTFLPESTIPPEPSEAAPFAQHQPAPSATDRRPLPTSSAMLFYLPSQGETIETVAAKMGADPNELALLNYRPVTSTLAYAETFLLPEHLSPVTPPEQPPVYRPRLFANLTVLEPVKLQQQMLESSATWHSVWLTAWVVEYGPAGYVGPPVVEWAQLWLNQPDQSLQILNTEIYPYHRWTLELDGRVIRAMRGDTWNWADVSHGLLASSPLKDLVFPARSKWLAPGSHLQIDIEDMVTSRKAQAADWINPEGSREYRLWVDVQTGVVLRMQQFGGPEYGTLIREIVVDTIGFDLESVPDLFQSGRAWQAFLARDFSQIPHGRPDPEKYTWKQAPGHRAFSVMVPPQEFDPAGSGLTFQYPMDLSQQQLIGAPRPVVYVFSGGYFLGSLQMVFGPFSTQCDRTQDGNWVALGGQDIYSLESFSHGEPSLSWFKVGNIQDIKTIRQPVQVDVLAFSPDNQRLAFSGSVGNEGREGIYLLTLSTGNLTRLRDISALDLAWSPGGDQLAWVGFTDGQLEWTVMELAGRKISFHEMQAISPGEFMYLQDTFRAPSGMPVHQWGLNFPDFNRGLDGCLGPPGQ